MNKRGKKFKAKLSGDNRKRLYDTQKESMVKQEKEHTKKLVEIEEQVKGMLPDASTILLPYYIIFAKEIMKVLRKHKGETLLGELEILQNKWSMRGLSIERLNKIKTFYVPSYKPVVCVAARFDVGRFDVDCFG